MLENEMASLVLEMTIFLVGSFLLVYGMLFLINQYHGFKLKKRKEQRAILIMATVLFAFVVMMAGGLLAYDSVSQYSQNVNDQYGILMGTTYDEVYWDMQDVLAGYNDIYSFTLMFTRTMSTLIGSTAAYMIFVRKAPLQKK
ncbi:hypothetical protein [Candidatus Xianfuyuplasma coldseepsis]|uniref:Uncharacterized protein n=1 Tax=Candidatus Xianfuyuplasma coldseepsis TaxID=2782163 RepID=A0A7L7KR36_9MOLU|nr:hypothetical protein [Xianfuyuplasma coldseepsis]QMS84414.1 hypothetical protein G4Z02_01205 [Xianfuyuplasma coldseepsis]